jgi:hypothetical protein
MKPNVDSVQVHPKLSNNIHPMDGVPMSAGSLWSKTWHDMLFLIIRHRGLWAYVHDLGLDILVLDLYFELIRVCVEV